MTSADLATTVIACPVCGTQYQVPRTALGAAGREVRCAQCGEAWHARAERSGSEDDRLFAPGDEAMLDAAFEAEARASAPPIPPVPVSHDPHRERVLAELRAAIAPKPAVAEVPADPAQVDRRRKDFDRRQANIVRRLPMARMRRTVRLAALVLLASVLMLGVALRTDIVRQFPSLAGPYEALGLPVNIVGLTFEDTKTVTSLRDGKTVMQIRAKIRAVGGQTVSVPAVLVSLLDNKGTTLYEWTVTPKAPQLATGDALDFSTEVNTPPVGAATVRLSFTTRGTATPSSG